ncbi:MAG: hypothetical protein QE278_14140 [Limnobacter sp.]|nr:hypothetical protein [Limnobacter sp.]
MHVYGKHIFNSQWFDGLGFDRKSVSTAVREFLARSQQNSIYSKVLQDALRSGGPLSAPSNPLNPIQIWGTGRLTQVDGNTHGCETPNRTEASVIQKVVDTINAQFKAFGMEQLRMEFSTESNTAAPDIRIAVCDTTYDGSRGYLANASPTAEVVLRRGDVSPWLVSHELTHLVGDHPDAFVDLKQINPLITQSMCEKGPSGYPASNLMYRAQCADLNILERQGSDNFQVVDYTKPPQMGEFELARFKQAYGTQSAKAIESAREFSSNQFTDRIRNDYGAKMSAQFTASMVGQALSTLLGNAVENTEALNPSQKQVLHHAVRLLVFSAQGLMMSPNSMSMVFGAGLMAAGCLSHSMRSVGQLLGQIGLAQVFMDMLRQNSQSAYALVYALAGHHAGRIVGECVSSVFLGGLERTKKYLDTQYGGYKPNPNVSDFLVDALTEKVDSHAWPQPMHALALNTQRVLNVLQKVDRAMAKVLDQAVSLNGLYSLLFKTPAVEADVDLQVNPHATRHNVSPSAPPAPDSVPSTPGDIELAIAKPLSPSELANFENQYLQTATMLEAGLR